jgi:pilus assembly protein Flp/PilA
MQRFLHCRSGATAIEYGLICALIVLVCVAGITVLGGGNSGMWSNLEEDVVNADN